MGTDGCSWLVSMGRGSANSRDSPGFGCSMGESVLFPGRREREKGEAREVVSLCLCASGGVSFLPSLPFLLSFQNNTRPHPLHHPSHIPDFPRPHHHHHHHQWGEEEGALGVDTPRTSFPLMDKQPNGHQHQHHHHHHHHYQISNTNKQENENGSR
jgi:hypothetical protein